MLISQGGLANNQNKFGNVDYLFYLWSMKLWDYLNKEHGLILVESEIHDILELARQEIELPEEWEMIDASVQWLYDMRGRHEKDYLMGDFEEGWRQALNKVRNPYPKGIRFKEDPEEFFKK